MPLLHNLFKRVLKSVFEPFRPQKDGKKNRKDNTRTLISSPLKRNNRRHKADEAKKALKRKL